jgi:hypothetical protein
MSDETVAFLSDLASKLKAGTLANRPAAGNSGNFYATTDQSPNHLYYDNGSSWVDIGAFS